MIGSGIPVAFAVTLVLIVSPPAWSAQPGDAPGRYLLTEHVTVPEGKALSYPGLVAQIRGAADATKAATWWIAASNLTGDLRRVTQFTFYDSVASFEQDVRALRGIEAEAARRNGQFAAESGQLALAPHVSLAVLRDDLSIPNEKVPPSAARYWAVTTMFLKAGHMSGFAERTKLEMDLLKKAGLDHHFLVYQVMVGEPSSGSVFYVMTPMTTLAEMDQDDSPKAAAVFTAEVRHRFESMNQAMISGIEADLLMVRPDLSRPPASYVQADPGFWTTTSIR